LVRIAQAKDSLRATSFSMSLTECQQTIVSLESGKFAQIGDARRTPNFYLSHGLNDAIIAGLEFSRAISRNSFEEYKSKIQGMDAYIDTKMADKIRKDKKAEDENTIPKNIIIAVDRLIEHLTLINKDHIALAKLMEGREKLIFRHNINEFQAVVEEINAILAKSAGVEFDLASEYFAADVAMSSQYFDSTRKLINDLQKQLVETLVDALPTNSLTSNLDAARVITETAKQKIQEMREALQRSNPSTITTKK